MNFQNLIWEYFEIKIWFGILYSERFHSVTQKSFRKIILYRIGQRSITKFEGKLQNNEKMLDQNFIVASKGFSWKLILTSILVCFKQHLRDVTHCRSKFCLILWSIYCGIWSKLQGLLYAARLLGFRVTRISNLRQTRLK